MLSIYNFRANLSERWDRRPLLTPGKVRDCFLIFSVVVSSLGRSLQARLETSKAITWDYTAAAVYQQSPSKKYTHQPVQGDKNAVSEKSHSIFSSFIICSNRPNSLFFSVVVVTTHWFTAFTFCQGYDNSAVALQRDSLGECLVCWPTRARSSLCRYRTWPHQQQTKSWQHRPATNVFSMTLLLMSLYIEWRKCCHWLVAVDSRRYRCSAAG